MEYRFAEEAVMSTFKIEDSKIVDTLFPETHWKAVDEPTYEQIFKSLLSEDPLKTEMKWYIQKRKPRIGYHRQYKSGGGWTLLGNGCINNVKAVGRNGGTA